MSNIKETLLKTLINGKETLRDIEVFRKNGKDFITEKNKVDNLIASLHPSKLDLVVEDIIEASKESKTFRFASENGYLPPFEAGQYINVAVEIDGVRTTRPYSISSSPKQKAYYEITVARIAKGFVSDYFLDNVKIGDKFEANGPSGVFRFNPVFHYKRSVFLAGGSGITPFMSMIREILESGLEREIYLIYGCRNAKVAIFDKELRDFSEKHPNFHYDLVISDDEKWSGKKGFIDSNCIKECVKTLDNTTFYLCGPQIMTDFCIEALDKLKVRPKNIRREVFGTPQIIQKEPGWPKELSGKEVFSVKIGEKTIKANANEPLLTALEKAGIRIKVCCRSGGCSLCRVKLISGKVFMPRGVLLRLADEKFGYIHSCKAYPISDLEIRL